MPPKSKKQRASLKLDETSGEVKEAEEVRAGQPAGRQVVEVVEDESVPNAIETIKKDAEEIEEAVETIEDEVQEEVRTESTAVKEEETEESTKGNVE